MKPGISAIPATIAHARGIVTQAPSASAHGPASTMESSIQAVAAPMATANLSRTGRYQPARST